MTDQLQSIVQLIIGLGLFALLAILLLEGRTLELSTKLMIMILMLAMTGLGNHIREIPILGGGEGGNGGGG